HARGLALRPDRVQARGRAALRAAEDQMAHHARKSRVPLPPGQGVEVGSCGARGGDMNAFDILLVLLALAGVFFGFRKGLVRILVGMGALVVAFLLASRLDARAGGWLAFTGMSEKVRLLVGYLLVFFGVMLVGGVLSWLARKLVKAAMLGW